MSKTFLDTNVILDAFLPDRPSAEASRQILAIGNETDRLYLSSLSMANLDYVLRKNLGKDRAIGILDALFKRFYVLPVNDMNVYEALHSDCPDFEDMLQVSCADYGNATASSPATPAISKPLPPFPYSRPRSSWKGSAQEEGFKLHISQRMDY